MSTHIGEKIKFFVQARKMTVNEFADKIHYSRRNIYDIFEKESIDTSILLRINEVLGINLFMYFITEADIEKWDGGRQGADAELCYLITAMRKKIRKIRRERNGSKTSASEVKEHRAFP